MYKSRLLVASGNDLAVNSQESNNSQPVNRSIVKRIKRELVLSESRFSELRTRFGLQNDAAEAKVEPELTEIAIIESVDVEISRHEQDIKGDEINSNADPVPSEQLKDTKVEQEAPSTGAEHMVVERQACTGATLSNSALKLNGQMQDESSESLSPQKAGSGADHSKSNMALQVRCDNPSQRGNESEPTN